MKEYLSLIKFSHTIFALPFAMIGFFIALHQLKDPFSWSLLGLVLLAMIFARSAAMAFNRYIDRDIDKANPRTAGREIPAGKINPKAALRFVILNCLLFMGTTFLINPLCFYLSPIALIIVLGYSYTKRFTALCHFVLGIGLALAPIGAYLAAGGFFDPIPIIYSFAVLFWVSGFDIIYALQDEQFDQTLHLHSVPAKIGSQNALLLSTLLHVLCAGLLILAAYKLDSEFVAFNQLTWAGTIVFLALLAYQHTIVKSNDLSRVNLAFFTTNGLASLFLGFCIILDLWI